MLIRIQPVQCFILNVSVKFSSMFPLYFAKMQSLLVREINICIGKRDPGQFANAILSGDYLRKDTSFILIGLGRYTRICTFCLVIQKDTKVFLSLNKKIIKKKIVDKVSIIH